MINRQHNIFLIIFFFGIFFWQHAFSQAVSVTAPQSGAQFTLPATVTITAAVTGTSLPEPANMRVQNVSTGFRKLKFGYSPTSLYSPLQNVIAGGNTQMEITMKLVSGTVDWTKILVKPMGIGTLALQPYITAAGGLGSSYKVITIPLSDFSSTINFTQIANIELPYSANAAPFDIAISHIKFTGGSTPFLWFGDNKLDNMQNGNGGSGELIARVVQASYPASYPQKVEFYDGNIKISEALNAPYQFDYVNPAAGSHQFTARLIMTDNHVYTSQPVSINVQSPAPPPVSVAITHPLPGDSLIAPANLNLTATVTGMSSLSPDYMLVSNPQTGFRKLKFGYSPTSLYSPLMDVIAGGNTTLEITLRDVNGGADWSKIQIRPAGLGTLSLLPYVNAAGGVGFSWTTITIPLADFISSVNFSAMSNIEFPYSASAPYFSLAIKSIRFIGGPNPFTWFGFGKINNMVNGNGGSGELVASLVHGNSVGDYIEKVEFFSGDTKLGADIDEPFSLALTNLPGGNYSFTARMTSHAGIVSASPAVSFKAYQPPMVQSAMSVSITTPTAGSSWLAPLNLPLGLAFTGAIPPGPDYLKVTNTLTGFVKLKLGYSATSIYTPKLNVVAGGNDTIELVIRNLGGAIDWARIRIRPEGIGTVNLGPYASMLSAPGDDWRTVKIPLSAFDTSIHFTSMGYMEFPFSAGANNFVLGVQRIRFIGGSAPFTWFGNGKTNNANDGDGLTGHMTATVVSPNTASVEVAGVRLFDNGVMVSEDFQAPFRLVLPNPQTGLHNLWVRMVDTKNGVDYSDTVSINIITQVPDGNLLVTVTFDHSPSTIAVGKAPLRYDKDFAYTLSLDDGLIDANSVAFKLLNGGYSPATFTTYPGLFYTDGCGKKIPFRANLMWYSVSSSFSEIHINTPSYITWPQLNQMIDSGWAVVNHSYSHATGTGINYLYQITANDSAVYSHTGRHLNHFDAPSGDAGYIPAAWQSGIACLYTSSTTGGSSYGLKVDQPLNYNEFTVHRDFKSDDLVNASTITLGLDNCALLSQYGSHYWYNDFTHHVSPVTYGGSLQFPLFKSYMEYAASTYGQAGSDRMWMASGVEVFEYLKLRDACPVTWSLFENQLSILINRDNVPADLLKYAMSLTIDADASITSASLNDNMAVMSYRGNTPRKLINLEWQQLSAQVSNRGVTAGSGMVPPGSPAEHLDLRLQDGSKNLDVSLSALSAMNGHLTVYNIQGKTVFSGDLNSGSSIHGKYTLNLTGLTNGIYLVRYTGKDGKNYTGKFAYPQ